MRTAFERIFIESDTLQPVFNRIDMFCFGSVRGTGQRQFASVKFIVIGCAGFNQLRRMICKSRNQRKQSHGFLSARWSSAVS